MKDTGFGLTVTKDSQIHSGVLTYPTTSPGTLMTAG